MIDLISCDLSTTPVDFGLRLRLPITT